MKAFDFQPLFKKSILDNGVRVVTEHHPFSRSTSAGIYVDLGTRDEPEDLQGAAHFVEHIVFKGTRTRSAFEIARTLEAVGGDLNAFTTRENTCFHAVTLSEHLPLSLDVLSDLVSNASFSPQDFERERQVILQEIDMAADNLEEFIFDLYFEEAYKGHTLGRNILGSPKSLMSITRKNLMDFYLGRYHGRELLVSIAGNVNHDKVVEQLNSSLGQLKRRPYRRAPRKKPRAKRFRRVLQRPSEQVHILLGLPSCPFKDDYRFESYIVNALLGGGMTSRLYRKIRENRGLAYSVYSYLHSFTDGGLMMVYAGTSPNNVKKVTQLILQEFENLLKNGIRKSELNLFKTQVKGSILLGADDMENRMNSIAVNELVFGEYRPVEKVVADIDEIDARSVKSFIQRYFDLDKLGLFVVGDIKEDKVQQWVAGL